MDDDIVHDASSDTSTTDVADASVGPADTAFDDSADSALDVDDDTTQDTPPDAPACPDGADPNACGGCTPLRAEPGSACGPCEASAFTCEGTDDVTCNFALCACTSDIDCGTGEACTAGACAPEGWAWIPPGEFVMGLSEEESFSSGETVTAGAVRITRGYLMGVTEVSQDAWFLVMPDDAPERRACEARCPVSDVTLELAFAYANAMSQRDGLEQCYSLEESEGAAIWPSGLDCLGHRLPTNAEWEYAARAGTQTMTYAGNFGLPSPSDPGPIPVLDAIAWHWDSWRAQQAISARDGLLCIDDGTCGPSGVGQLDPNAFGLYDALGNVAELTSDQIEPSQVMDGSDPVGEISTSNRVNARGGSYLDPPSECRAGRRSMGTLARDPHPRNGVRLVRTVIQ